MALPCLHISGKSCGEAPGHLQQCCHHTPFRPNTGGFCCRDHWLGWCPASLMGFGRSQKWRISSNIPPNPFRFLQHCSEIQRPACPEIPISGQLVSLKCQQIDCPDVCSVCQQPHDCPNHVLYCNTSLQVVRYLCHCLQQMVCSESEDRNGRGLGRETKKDSELKVVVDH